MPNLENKATKSLRTALKKMSKLTMRDLFVNPLAYILTTTVLSALFTILRKTASYESQLEVLHSLFTSVERGKFGRVVAAGVLMGITNMWIIVCAAYQAILLAKLAHGDITKDEYRKKINYMMKVFASLYIASFLATPLDLHKTLLKQLGGFLKEDAKELYNLIKKIPVKFHTLPLSNITNFTAKVVDVVKKYGGDAAKVQKYTKLLKRGVGNGVKIATSIIRKF